MLERIDDTSLPELGFLDLFVQHYLGGRFVAVQRDRCHLARYTAIPFGRLLFDFAGARRPLGNLPVVRVEVADDGFLENAGHGEFLSGNGRRRPARFPGRTRWSQPKDRYSLRGRGR